MEKMRDFNKKTVVITGATSGIGKAVALKMAELGHKIIIVARNHDKIKKLMHEITHTTQNVDLKYYVVDLSVLHEIYWIGLQIAKENPVIDILVNNAGIFTDKRTMTIDGFESTFAINYLSPFLLTHTLFSSLCKSKNAQVLNVSSSAHYFGKVHWDDLGFSKRWYGFKAYGQSKLLLNMASFELARRLKETNIRVNAIHPGVVRTNLGGNLEKKESRSAENFMSRMVIMLGITPKESGDAIVEVLSDEKFRKNSGKYYSINKIRTPSYRSRNVKNQKRLRDLTYFLLKDYLNMNEIFETVNVCL
ncbi:MAG: SDR family NAD(P)-dependent oxidoreductase [Promethearchaeota archaeon]